MKAGLPPPSHGIQRISWVIAVVIGLLSPLHGYAKAGQEIPLAAVVVDDSGGMRKTDPPEIAIFGVFLVAVITDVRLEVAFNQKSYVTGEEAHVSAQEARHRSLFEQYRSFFETRHHLKLENLRLAGKARTQERRLEELQQAKTRLENQLQRLKGVEEAHQLSQRNATQLEEQLQRAHEEIGQLKGEISALSVEYLRFFERQSS